MSIGDIVTGDSPTTYLRPVGLPIHQALFNEKAVKMIWNDIASAIKE